MANGERLVWPIALAVTVLIQVAVSFLAQAMNVLAPSLTQAANVSSEQIGTLAGFVAFGTLWFLMGGSRLLVDIASVRLLQVGVLLSAFGLLLALAGFWPATLLAALLVGLGYGPTPPAGNQILMSTAPAAHRGLIFSIKQSGVPLGSALAGFLLPFIAERWGWAAALLIASILAAATAVAVEPFRSRIDLKQSKAEIATVAPLFSLRMLLAPFSAVKKSKALPFLAYTGFAFAVAQGSIFAMYVTFLVTSVGMDLTSAGMAFGAMQLVGAFARILVGWVADRTHSALAVLAALGLLSSTILVVVAYVQLSWGWSLIASVSSLAGLCVASWNGVLMSEIAKASPIDSVGEATSAATFFTFLGYIMGPVSFAAIVRIGFTFTEAFTLVAILPVTGTLVLYLLYQRSHPLQT